MSPFLFYQFLLTSVGDAEVVSFMRMLTFRPLSEISAIEADMATSGYVPNTAQRILAADVTRFVHGDAGLQQALAATAVRLGLERGNIAKDGAGSAYPVCCVSQALAPGADTQLDAAALEAAGADAPSATLPRERVVAQQLADVLMEAGLQPSKAAARRLIKVCSHHPHIVCKWTRGRNVTGKTCSVGNELSCIRLIYNA